MPHSPDNVNSDQLSNMKSDTRESHVLLVNNPEGKNNDFTQESWAGVLKTNISKKLEEIPVKKVLLNKKGQGCIVLPDKSTCNNAKDLLKTEFDVTDESKKAKPLLPRLKIHDIEHEKFVSKEALLEKILRKNSRLKTDANAVELTYYDAARKYAVLKVSPKIEEEMMKDPRIFIDMESHHVSKYYHVDVMRRIL